MNKISTIKTVVSSIFLALLVFGCLFETVPQVKINPKLKMGDQWLYRHREYTEYEGGSKGDSTSYFIHYQITGDTLIGGLHYLVMVEEDLALFNTDDGLITNRSLHALRWDTFASELQVKALKGSGPATGRFPFKVASGKHEEVIGPSFDTLHFQDEVITLKTTLAAGQSWAYRGPGSPYGFYMATKTFKGLESVVVSGKVLLALKFQIEVDQSGFVRIFEWYVGDVKVLSRSSSSRQFGSKDSARIEEEYLGVRSFTKEDTLIILWGKNLESMGK